MSHSTTDIPGASVGYVMSEAVINTHTHTHKQDVDNNGPALRSVSW
jgi:hypothetical protein